MEVMRNARNYVLAVLSVGSRSGFMRSGSGRVEDIVASMNDITSDLVGAQRGVAMGVRAKRRVERVNRGREAGREGEGSKTNTHGGDGD